MNLNSLDGTVKLSFSQILFQFNWCFVGMMYASAKCPKFVRNEMKMKRRKVFSLCCRKQNVQSKHGLRGRFFFPKSTIKKISRPLLVYAMVRSCYDPFGRLQLFCLCILPCNQLPVANCTIVTFQTNNHMV